MRHNDIDAVFLLMTLISLQFRCKMMSLAISQAYYESEKLFFGYA